MPLSLRNIYQPSGKDYTIVVHNYRDRVTAFLPPDIPQLIFGRWLDQGSKFTEINITSQFGRSATIILEDIDWAIWVSGNIRGGRKQYAVDGSKDFDVYFTSDGGIELRVQGGVWSKSVGASIRLDILPFVE